MSGNVTIYLSSTYEDLKDYRRAVCDALRRSGYEVIAMEDYVAQDQRPVAKCLADVDRADIYVGLFGFRYGYVPPVEHGNPEGRSITELELRRADANPKTCCLTYCLDEKAGRLEFTDAYTGENERGARIAALREHLRREKLAPLFSAPHQLASEVQAAVSRHLRQSTPGAATSAEPAVAVTWNLAERGSPYPGLMHFTRTHASVFFGRDAEVREVLDRLWQPEVRFVLISGDSGSGKSSLVDAGVLPKLETLGLPQDRRCRSVRLVPSEGADPFDALARALHGLAQEAGFNPYALSRELAAAPEALPDRLATLMARGLNSDALVLFLDQLEELFTAASTDEQRRLADAFVTGLCRATERTDLRVIATLRSDWLPVCHRHPDLLAVLRGPGHYPLGPVEPGAMHDMIVRPARAAGLEIAESLARRLIRDAGAEPGNLPLLAFVLERLFAERKDDTLSESVYERFGGSDSETGGLKGALADYVRVVEAAIGSDPALGAEGLARLEDLFPALVVLSLAGQPTRRRAAKLDFDPVLQPIVERLVKARLLTSAGEGEAATVSVAHEKLFEAWPRLARWVEEHREELRILRQAELDASEWQRRGYDLDYLWHVRRLKGLRAIVEDLPTERVSPAVRALAQPQDRLIARLDDPALPLAQRLVIGQYLAELGDPRPGVGVHPDGTPDIAWVPIPGGYVVLEDGAGEAEVAPFAMARYPVTNAQFQAFVEAR